MIAGAEDIMDLEIKVQGMTCVGCTSGHPPGREAHGHFCRSELLGRPACGTSASPGQHARVALTSAGPEQLAELLPSVNLAGHLVIMMGPPRACLSSDELFQCSKSSTAQLRLFCDLLHEGKQKLGSSSSGL